MTNMYKYTVDGTLSKEQRDFYEENGFLLFKKLIPDEDIDVLCKRFLDVCNGKVKIYTVMKDQASKSRGETRPEYLINKIQEILYDEVFFKHYAAHPNIVNVIKNIIGPNISGAHSMLINKPPDSTVDLSRHPMHQDIHYFPFRPSNSIVASWTAMEDINERNGCLFALPGSHKGPMYSHEYTSAVKNALYHGIFGFDAVPKVNFIMEKGDTIFFHPHLIHGSGPNLTKGFRKAISVHYADSNCTFIDVYGTIQENIAKEIEQLAEKGLKTKVSFQEIWKMKSRLICGKPGSFQTVNSHL